MKKIYFTPGPSQVYFTLEEHMKSALKEQIPSISHRGAKFKSIFQSTTEGLKTLMGIPDNFRIVFTSSATEVWERTIQNCVATSSLHITNGAFSNKFHQVAQQLGINATQVAVPDGSCINPSDLIVEQDIELISIAHNETSTGACQPVEDIYTIRKQHPKPLLTVDVVSSAPYVDLDFSQIDSAYFSAQKCFGLPAGLGVWIFNERCLEKAIALEQKGHITGTNHRLSQFAKFADKSQTPSTPNVLDIYLLNKVVQDMLTKGILQIRREINYKAAVLYHMLEQSNILTPFVGNPNHQSKTTVVARMTSGDNQALLQYLNSKGLVVGNGYSQCANEHIRIANFPTHSKEQIEMLSDMIIAFENGNN